MKNWVKLSAAAVMVFFCSTALSQAAGQYFFFENPLLGKPAPEFKLDTVKGRNESLTAFRDGKPAVIFFWATWCPHCREQLRGLNKEVEVFKEKEIKIALVDLGETAKQVQSYIDKNKIDMDVFLDKDSAIAEKYGVVGVPTFIFVDENGVVQGVEHFLPDDYENYLTGNKG